MWTWPCHSPVAINLTRFDGGFPAKRLRDTVCIAAARQFLGDAHQHHDTGKLIMKTSFYSIATLLGLALAVCMTQTANAQVSNSDMIWGVFVPYGAYDANVNNDVNDSDIYTIQYYLSLPGPYQNFSHPGSFGQNARDVSTSLQDVEDAFTDADYLGLNWDWPIDGANADYTVTALDSLLPINFLYRNNPIFQNSSDQFDVNTDGTVTARDALNVINHLNSTGSALPSVSSIATKASTHWVGFNFFGNVNYPVNLLWIPNHMLRQANWQGIPEPYFVDVDGDGVVTNADALDVIDYLNQQ